MKVTCFTKEHPECEPDEIYLLNVVRGEFKSDYKTLRWGYTTYKQDGVQFFAKGLYPVFVKEWEYLEVVNNG